MAIARATRSQEPTLLNPRTEDAHPRIGPSVIRKKGPKKVSSKVVGVSRTDKSYIRKPTAENGEPSGLATRTSTAAVVEEEIACAASITPSADFMESVMGTCTDATLVSTAADMDVRHTDSNAEAEAEAESASGQGAEGKPSSSQSRLLLRPSHTITRNPKEMLKRRVPIPPEEMEEAIKKRKTQRLIRLPGATTNVVFKYMLYDDAVEQLELFYEDFGGMF